MAWAQNAAWLVPPPPVPTHTTYPVEVFKMKLFEDGVSAFQFIPPYRPQIWQQLVPLLSTQPVCLASLGEGEQRPQGLPFKVKNMPQTFERNLAGLAAVDTSALPQATDL